MQKTYLVKARTFKEITDGKGALEYLLLDENGIERKVTATAQQGHIREFKNIKAIYKRELPLVKALAKATVNSTVYIDFSKFNAKNPRQKTGRVGIKSKNVNTKRSSDYSEIQDIFTDKKRLFKLLFISIVGFTGVLLTNNYS